MKRIITTICLLFSIVSQAQELKPLKIYHTTDDMTKKERFYTSRRLVYADTITKENNLEVQAFGVNLTLEKKKESAYCDGIAIKCKTIGCIDNCKIIILFDNDETIEKTAFSKFDCDGDAFFELSKKDLQKLSLLQVKKIRILNGLNYQSVTGLITETDYFINVLKLLENGDFTEK